MLKKSLPYRNLKGRPGRTAALALLSAFLCLALLGGSLFVSGLRRGLDSLENRLGADIMVVPYEAVSKSSLEGIILQGNKGYFYMDNSRVSKVAEVEGIGQMSTQMFMVSTSSGCCSVAVQIIGFDPETDFTILPWVNASYKGNLQDMEVLVGCQLNAFPGDTLRFYDTEVKVAARLDETGTYLDTAVYASNETIKILINNAQEKKLSNFEVDPDTSTSCILINVADGYSIDEVLNNINIHMKNKVKAVKTKSLISDVAGKLEGVSSLASVLVAAIWVLSLVIMMIIFIMISNERKKEFAILRAMGASRRKLTNIIFEEALLVAIPGSVIGAAVAVGLSSLLGNIVEGSLQLPFLLPGAAGRIILIVAAIAVTVLAGALAAAISASRISKMDTANILRGEN